MLDTEALQIVWWPLPWVIDISRSMMTQTVIWTASYKLLKHKLGQRGTYSTWVSLFMWLLGESLRTSQLDPRKMEEDKKIWLSSKWMEMSVRVPRVTSLEWPMLSLSSAQLCAMRNEHTLCEYKFQQRINFVSSDQLLLSTLGWYVTQLLKEVT